LDIKEKFFGREHSNIANVLNNLGNAYGNLGENQKKKELLQEALEINEKAFGKHHPNVVTTLNNLGITYTVLGEHQKAIDLLEKALEINEKSFGRQHPNAANILRDLGTIHIKLGKHQKAIALLQKALEINEKNSGRQHSSIAIGLYHLGIAYKGLGDFTQAFNSIKEAYNIYVEILGKDHDKTKRVYQSLYKLCATIGNNYFLNNETEAAQTYYKELGLNIMDPSLHKDIIFCVYQQNRLPLAIEHSKILTLLTPNDAGNWHNLGFFYHIQAKITLERSATEEGQLILQDAEGCFAQGIALNESSAILTEYANFLLINNQAHNAKKHLIRALALKEDGSTLCYRKMAKPILSLELQQEIDVNTSISSQAYLFAYYYLIRHYKLLNLSKIELEKYLGDFKYEVTKEANAFSYALLGYCYKHLEKYTQAEQAFEKAFSIDSNYSLAKENFLSCHETRLPRAL
ncbi:MAG: tetratricopeptide repeat protein, partial [Burkholderiales bacterium]